MGGGSGEIIPAFIRFVRDSKFHAAEGKLEHGRWNGRHDLDDRRRLVGRNFAGRTVRGSIRYHRHFLVVQPPSPEMSESRYGRIRPFSISCNRHPPRRLALPRPARKRQRESVRKLRFRIVKATVSIADRRVLFTDSMSEPDPYAPPATSEITPACPAHGFRRDGEFVVVRTGAVLPQRCIQTNEPIGQGDWSKEKKLHGSPKWAGLCTALPYLTLLLLQNWLPSIFKDYFAVVIVAMMIGSVAIASIFHKTCFITYGLKGSVQRKQRRTRLIFVGLLGLAGVALMLCAFLGHFIWVFIVLLGMVIVISLSAVRLSRFIRVIRYRDGEFWLKGCSPEFLDSLDKA
jgi:hypothetical protein